MDASPTSTIPVKIITSSRRKKTVAARFVGDTIEIRMPEGLSETEQQRHVHDLTRKLSAKGSASQIDLPERAGILATKYQLPSPTSITWSSRQRNRWGSCTPSTGAIRLSDRMTSFPQWVVDYVIVHELSHLVEANHSGEFYELERRFHHCDKAEGFLIAVALGHAGTLSSVNPEPCIDDPSPT